MKIFKIILNKNKKIEELESKIKNRDIFIENQMKLMSTLKNVINDLENEKLQLQEELKKSAQKCR